MTERLYTPADGPMEEQVAYVIGNLLAKHEARVDAFLKRLSVGIGTGNKTRELRRLDRAMLMVAAGMGVMKGLGTTARRNLKIPTRVITRISSVGLLSFTALYILGHARVRGLTSTDPRVQDAVRNALMTSAALPVGQLLIENLARFARPSLGLPTDPRTWFVVAAGSAAGGIAGNALGRGIVEGVYGAFGDVPTFVDFESDPEEIIIEEWE